MKKKKKKRFLGLEVSRCQFLTGWASFLVTCNFVLLSAWLAARLYLFTDSIRQQQFCASHSSDRHSIISPSLWWVKVYPNTSTDYGTTFQDEYPQTTECQVKMLHSTIVPQQRWHNGRVCASNVGGTEFNSQCCREATGFLVGRGEPQLDAQWCVGADCERWPHKDLQRSLGTR